MNFLQYINILWSRKFVVLLALTMTIITTLVISLFLPKQYVATTSIILNQRSVDAVTGQTLPVQLLSGYIATQVDIISSHNVARKVVEKLNLTANPQVRKDFAKTKSTNDITDWAADSLLKNLEIRPSHESSLIEIDFTSIDPQFSATIANIFAEAYIQTNIELRAQPAKLSADWFDSQIALLRKNLEHAQSVLSTYQQKNGIVATDDRLDIENARLSEISQQLVENQGHTSELQSRKDLLMATLEQGGSSESLQEVLSNPLIQSLKAELARAEARFAELSKRVDINHPQYKQIEAEVSSLQQDVNSEIKKILKNIVSEVVSSEKRNNILAKSLAEQKAKVLELKKQHDEIAVYKRDVENAQRSYDAAMQRAIQTRMESEMSQTDIAILNPAMPPQYPTKPKILLNIILSVFLGSILGIGFAFLVEFMDYRVRSAFDITEKLGLPVFAIVSVSASQSKMNGHNS